jgi:xanthine dehydrogenase accessory factor
VSAAATAATVGAHVVPWLDSLAEALAAHGQAGLVVVATAQGSTPRETGAAMIVSRDRCAGSIGGGHLEHDATRIARDALHDAASAGNWIVRYPLAARLGQCCGGVATLAFARLDAGASAWLDAALACARTGSPFAIVSRVATSADAATRLVVTDDDVRGTLGDVALDSAAIGLARTRLAGAGDGAALVRFAKDGEAALLIHVERCDAFPVWLFGNGHVGRALVKVLGVVPARVTWLDSRAADFPEQVPANVEVVVTDAPEDELPHAPAGAFVVVTTHSHAQDFALIEAALARDDWRYLGLIGSKSKRAQFERRLAARGFPAEAFARIRCPIGVGAVPLRAKHPGAIAVAIAAELLVVREAGAHRAEAPREVPVLRGNRATRTL